MTLIPPDYYGYKLTMIGLWWSDLFLTILVRNRTCAASPGLPVRAKS